MNQVRSESPREHQWAGPGEGRVRAGLGLPTLGPAGYTFRGSGWSRLLCRGETICVFQKDPSWVGQESKQKAAAWMPLGGFRAQ